MTLRVPYLIVALLAVLSCLAVASPSGVCGAGQYGSPPNCQYCPPGYYQPDNQNPQNACRPAQQGDAACGPQTVGGVPCYGATSQIQCSAGTYSPGAVAECIPCPAGYKCPGTQQSQPQPCSPGEYQPTPGYGGSTCPACPMGQFNNNAGATSCCPCCAGTYNDHTHQTHCFSCAEHTNNPRKPYSLPGATSSDQCQATPIPGVTNAPSCSNTAPSGAATTCPATQGGPAPSGGLSRRRVPVRCSRGYKRCPHYSGLGGFECVDINNDPESCGGCIGFDATSTDSSAEDCTAIPHVSVAKCVKRKCVVESCRKGYEKGSDGRSCNKRIGGLFGQTFDGGMSQQLSF